jgi:hypothetical protein
MKRIALCLLGIVLVVSCKDNQSQIDKVIESGIEVVLNHIEPYVLSGVPSTLALEEILTIDTEREEVVNTGMTMMEWFCLDRDGNIYLMMRNSPENFIYKYDADGKFVRSFGRKGQGPGELGYGGSILFDDKDRLIAKDMTASKYLVFTTDGVFVDEVKLGLNVEILKSLGNGTFLTSWQDSDPVKPVFRNHYCIGDAMLKANREFYEFEFDDQRAPRIVPGASAIMIGTSDENIYVGDSRDGYVIRVFDLSGKLVRKIRKEFRPVIPSAEYKASRRRRYEQMGANGAEILSKLSFPSHFPPFRFLFTDDEGRLFVMTNEREGDRTYLYDIFTKDGIFIGRCRLDNVQLTLFEGRRLIDRVLDVQVQGDRLYCLREKDSGYIVLSAYKMKWNYRPDAG